MHLVATPLFSGGTCLALSPRGDLALGLELARRPLRLHFDDRRNLRNCGRAFALGGQGSTRQSEFVPRNETYFSMPVWQAVAGREIRRVMKAPR